jgi:hypothetical protein
LVRNPVFTTMILTVVGFVLVVPNVGGVAVLLLLVAGVQLQVRTVQEPHLLATHPVSYRQYAARVGRFVPGIGKLCRDVERHALPGDGVPPARSPSSLANVTAAAP